MSFNKIVMKHSKRSSTKNKVAIDESDDEEDIVRGGTNFPSAPHMGQKRNGLTSTSNRKKSSSTSSSSSSSSSDSSSMDVASLAKVVETGQIGYKLAEELRAAREELLSLKQEKRILLVNCENMEDTLLTANSTIQSLRAQLDHAEKSKKKISEEKNKYETKLKSTDDECKELRKSVVAEKRKNKLLAEELERSLEDEAALRNYAKKMETEVVSLREQLVKNSEMTKAEVEERLKYQRIIEQDLRNNIVLLKKLETIIYFCDRNVDMSTLSILDVTPDYLDSLLQDLKVPLALQNSLPSNERFYDLSVLEYKRNTVNQQVNSYLANIKTHLTTLRKTSEKSRKYIRGLLNVIHSYEEDSGLGDDAPKTAGKGENKGRNVSHDNIDISHLLNRKMGNNTDPISTE